jgi:hypothetical protein
MPREAMNNVGSCLLYEVRETNERTMERTMHDEPRAILAGIPGPMRGADPLHGMISPDALFPHH